MSFETWLKTGDYDGAVNAYYKEFKGRENSVDGSWQLAEIQERWGDSLFFSGEAGAAGHYQKAQYALMPQGQVFTSASENGRRMKAYDRIYQKLYAIGPDGKPREGQECQAHPHYVPTKRPPQPEPVAQPDPWAGRAPALATPIQETPLAKLFAGNGHWEDHALGDDWFAIAKALGNEYPEQAYLACDWSIYYFELYNRAWAANLPSSRFDSDGGAEIMEVQEFLKTLVPKESTAPAWVAQALAGDWKAAVDSLANENPPQPFAPLAKLLKDAAAKK